MGGQAGARASGHHTQSITYEGGQLGRTRVQCADRSGGHIRGTPRTEQQLVRGPAGLGTTPATQAQGWGRRASADPRRGGLAREDELGKPPRSRSSSGSEQGLPNRLAARSPRIPGSAMGRPGSHHHLLLHRGLGSGPSPPGACASCSLEPVHREPQSPAAWTEDPGAGWGACQERGPLGCPQAGTWKPPAPPPLRRVMGARRARMEAPE